MLERWIIIISVAAFSLFLYFVFIAIIYNITIQLRRNNNYNNNASAIRHIIVFITFLLRCGEWLYSVFLTTTIRRIESGFNNFYYQCPPLLFTSRSRPIYIYIIESLVHVTYVRVRHYSPSFS